MANRKAWTQLTDVNPQVRGFALGTASHGIGAARALQVHAEAGATLAGAFLAAGLADEVLLYMAPMLLGDQARPLFGGLGIQAMADRLQLEIVDSRTIGEDHRLLLQPAR